jgi:ketol-acid reductoisomerase
VTRIYREEDADLAELAGLALGVVGYGNQGRSWSLNLRDSGLCPTVFVRADESRQAAQEDGFDTRPLEEAVEADVVCLLVPDDVIPSLPLPMRPDSLVVVASGYTLAFGRLSPPGDAGMVAPRMLGPEVRRCYEEGVGFISAVGVDRDVTGRAKARVLALARAIGGLRQGAIELSPRQEAVLDLSVEQALAPALKRASSCFVKVMLEQGIPVEAIVAELVLSGEVERTYRLVRLEGAAAQMAYHSPTSQYGQLSRAGEFDSVDLESTMRRIVEGIASGAFADEWDQERHSGYRRLKELRRQAASPEVLAFEADLRSRLGETSLRARRR